MENPRSLWEKLASFFRRETLDGDLDEEMAAHLDMAIEENLNRGMSYDEARRQALIRFGGVEQARQQHREARSLPMLETLMQDLRYCFRTMRRDRAFTIVAVLILALGIGANIVVFSVVNTILLRPLPFREPQQLTRILEKIHTSGESSMTYSVDATETFQQRNRSFQDVTGYFAFTGPDNFKLTDRAVPMPTTGILVMSNFFQTLGVEPILGRLFLREEAVSHARPVTLLSYPFWKRQFGGDPNIVGKAISFNNQPVTVVGVLPESFDFGSVFSPGSKVDMFVPFVMDDFRENGNDLALIGRLKPGVTIAQAQGEADTVFPELYFSNKHPNYGKGYTGEVFGLKDYVSGKLRRSLVVLWCAVGMILLIVCVNLSNLLLARSSARSKEFAMRSALGANRGRLIRQLLTESLVLAALGGITGLAIAFTATSYLAHQGSIALPLMSSVRVDGEALAWTLSIAVLAAVLFGLFPALRMSHTAPLDALKDIGPGLSGGRRHEKMRSALVISEVALACILLVGAGLLLRSFLRVIDVDLGFEPSRAAAISLSDDAGSVEKRSALWQEATRRALAIPGVEAAGISDNLPMSRNRSWGIAAKGAEQREDNLSYIGCFVYIVSPGYLQAMGMRLAQGRDISWEDIAANRPVVVINQTAARKLWTKGENPIGRTVVAGGNDAEVIGVIADVRETNAENSAGVQMYLPFIKQYGPTGAYLVVRSKLPPATLAPSVMHMLREINPGQPATEFKPIQTLVDHAVSPRKFFVLLVSIFAELGLLLAMLGIYGVISYSVSQQTQEIGIRMALGATRANVQFGVMSRTMKLAVAGIVIGSIASVVMARWIAALLFGTSPGDPLTFGGMVVIMSAVAFIAGFIPAVRASRIQPMVALRNQ